MHLVRDVMTLYDVRDVMTLYDVRDVMTLYLFSQLLSTRDG